MFHTSLQARKIVRDEQFVARWSPWQHNSVCLSVCLSVRLSVCPSVCLSVCHQDSEKSFARILTKFGQNVYLPLRRKPINFEISMFHRTVEKNKNAPFSSYKRSFFS